MTKSRTKKKLEDEGEGDPWFNPYRWPATPRALEVVGEVLFDFFEKRENRGRKRKTKDRQWLWQVGHVLVADLAYHYLSGSPGSGLVVPRAKRELGKKSRYHPPYFTRSFPKLLDTLQRLGYLRQKKGSYSGKPGKSKRTTIRPDVRFIELIEKHNVTFADLDVSDAEEVIILKRAKRNYWDKGEKIPYADTAVTKRLRTEVRELNSWFEHADIAFNPGAHDRPVDVRARRLYRYFAANFESGGRLFKGFWQTLPKPARLLGLRIEGEDVVELDFSQLNPMLAYAKVRCLPPPGDAYTLPGLEQSRDGVKKVFNALLFDKRPRKSFPKDVSVLFPSGTKIGYVVGAIREKHPMLGSVLSTGAGFHLMFLESEIMMRVLEQLRHQTIVGLPIFDGVIVKASKAEAAKIVMKEQFKKAMGLEIEVRLERSLAPDVH
jgi:hypothetical protein